MEQADEAVRSRDVGHGLFGIDVLEVVHDGCEFQYLLVLLRRLGLEGCRFALKSGTFLVTMLE